MVQVGVESENGWRPAKVGVDSLVWVTVPGTNVNLQVQKGWPAKVLIAFAADYHAFVEPLRDPDSASWTPTNSVATSNHLNGTAMDLNWNSHPFRVKGTFTASQMKTIRELLDFYEGHVFWAGDWREPIDEMHWQMGYETWNNPDVGDFINRKVRSDGFSTFRRGATQAQPKDDVAQTLSRAMLGSLPLSRYQQLLPAVSDALVRCGCNTVQRIAMWCAQIGHESGGLQWMEEIADGSAYEGRTDLGNTQPGDGRRFKGRGPIQVTGRSNYTLLSKWAHSQGLVPSPTFFVDSPQQLASDTYGFLGVIWYWTVARPGINSMADSQNLEGVTRAINGGLNGIDDRRNRYNQCLAMSSALLQLANVAASTPMEGFLMALSAEEQVEIRDKVRQLWGASFNPVPSKSRYGDPKDLWPSKDFDRNMDGFLYDLITEHDATLGDPAALARIQKASSNGDLIAQHFLEKLHNATVPGIPSPSPNLPANNVLCWNCNKRYPDVLPNCPFCGAGPVPPQAQEVAEVPSPASSSEAVSGKHAVVDAAPGVVGGLPAVDKVVVDQLSLLQRFNHELPAEIGTAINKLIPVLKGLTK